MSEWPGQATHDDSIRTIPLSLASEELDLQWSSMSLGTLLTCTGSLCQATHCGFAKKSYEAEKIGGVQTGIRMRSPFFSMA
jgi:hypothetical protein